MAEINLIALQSRFGGAEAAELLQLNISTDGVEFHSIGQIEGVTLADKGEVHREIGPVTTRFIRLIPITDRAMPVCIRTELFGCYRHDDLESYSLSSKPLNEDLNLDQKATGVGKLADNVTDEYLEFNSESGKIEMDFHWAMAKNLSRIEIHTLQTSQSSDCLHSVAIPAFNTEFEFDCKQGETMIPLNFEKMVSQLRLVFKFRGILKISEISWIEGDQPSQVSVLEPIETHSSEIIKNEYVTYAQGSK